MITSLLALLSESYYRSSAVRDSDRAAAALVRGLFDALLESPELIPDRFRVDSEAVAVATYIASLNDRTATVLAEELGVAQPLGAA
jgi:dGTP triphosphohydrolase